MSDLKLDSNGDLMIVDGDFVVVGATSDEKDLEESIKQDVLTTLRFLFGEWFLNTLDGIPLIEDILIKNPNVTVIYNIFTSKILSVKGVLGLETFTMNYDSSKRSLRVKFNARCSTGVINFDEELTVP